MGRLRMPRWNFVPRHFHRQEFDKYVTQVDSTSVRAGGIIPWSPRRGIFEQPADFRSIDSRMSAHPTTYDDDGRSLGRVGKWLSECAASYGSSVCRVFGNGLKASESVEKLRATDL